MQKLSLEEEKVLLAQVFAGSEAATRKLVLQHLDYVVSLAFRIVGNHHDAEEIAQDVFLKLFKQIEKWEHKAYISTWLYRVTYNRSIDYIRIKKRYNTYELNEEMHITHSEYQTDLASDFDEEAVLALEKNIGKLPFQQRAALTIFYFQNKKTREAAKIMDLSEDAFESLLRRARRKLKIILHGNVIDRKRGKNEEQKNQDATDAFRTSRKYAC